MFRSSFFIWMEEKMEKVQDEITSAQSTATVLDVVYWEPVSGNDSNDGKTKDTPVQTFEKALSLVKPGGMIAIYPLQDIDATINGLTIDKDVTVSFADEYYMEGKTETVNITLGTAGSAENAVFVKNCSAGFCVSKLTFGLCHLINASLDGSISQSVEVATAVNVNRSVLKVNNLICNGAVTGDNFYYLIRGTVNFPGAAYLADVRLCMGTLSIAQVTSFTLSDGSTLTDISSRILGIRKDANGKPLNIICDVEI